MCHLARKGYLPAPCTLAHPHCPEADGKSSLKCTQRPAPTQERHFVGQAQLEVQGGQPSNTGSRASGEMSLPLLPPMGQ
jgi:hypothetical protein